MMRTSWTLAAALALGFIAWTVFATPQKSALRLESSDSSNDVPDLRLISERSPYMRTER